MTRDTVTLLLALHAARGEPVRVRDVLGVATGATALVADWVEHGFVQHVAGRWLTYAATPQLVDAFDKGLAFHRMA